MKNRASKRPQTSLAFTLIELMVAVGLMTFIVLGLLVMFTQTQKAFKTSMTQTDVLESGRILTDMTARELGQMAAAGRGDTTNFYAELSPSFVPPLLQGMPGTALAPGIQDRRTNIVQRIFFLSLNNQSWNGTGYEVLPDANGGGAGTLYRFNMATNAYNVASLSSNFQYAVRLATNSLAAGRPVTLLTRLADGVVSFRVRAFATNGYPIVWERTRNNAVFRTNAYAATYPYSRPLRSVASYSWLPDEQDYYFMSNALPAYVELEVGILESHIVDRYKAIGNVSALAQRQYLSNHVAQVHVFRQRIPIRTVDFSAYQ